MIALIICDRTTCKRPNKTINFSLVIALLLQRSLHIGDYLVWWQAIISVDRSIPCIIRVGIVTPGWEPIPRVPIVRRTEDEHDVVTVMVMPPVLIVPLCFVVAEHIVLLAVPVLASLDASALLELHRRGLRCVWLFCNIKVLRLERLALCLLPLGYGLSAGRCPGGIGRFTSPCYLSTSRCCLACLGLICGLVLLRFLACLRLISGLGLLRLLALISGRCVLALLWFFPLIRCC